MTPERWQKIQQLLEAVLDRDPADRASLLDRECAGDPALRDEIESLLQSAKQTDGFLHDNVVADAAILLSDEVDDSSLLGRHIGPYSVKTRLGSGGMGEVYLAEDVRLGRRVALKLLDVVLAGDSQSRARFLREARLASLLDHPNICAVHEVGESRGRPFIAMQFVEGETVRKVIDGKPVKLEALLSISLQVAEALATAHAQGIVHRDIKAGNIMITPQGQAKVLDFGLAKLLEPDPSQHDTNVTVSGAVIGTPNSMSPEQARGEPADERSDIFSFGVVLYEMATGSVPFKGKTYAEVISSILKSEHEPATSLNPELPEKMSLVIDKSLAKDPSNRYQAMSELIADLKQVVREVGGLDRLFNSSDSPGAIMPLVPRGNLLQSNNQWRPRSTFLFASVVVLVTLTAGAFGVWRYKFDHGPRAEAAALPFAESNIKQLTTKGRVSWAALSPDGQFYAYVLMGRDEQGDSLWLGQTDAGNDIQLRPPGGKYQGLVFSPDNKSLFYTLNGASQVGLFRIPMLGGVVDKLAAKIAGKFSLSPDGKNVAFLRSNDNGSALVLADVESGGERELAVRPSEKDSLMNCMAWSPDGSMIATAAVTDASKESREIFIFRLSDGSANQLTTFEWTRVSSLVWTRNGEGLVVVGTNRTETVRHLWQVDYPSGQVRRLSRDTDGYGAALSISTDGKSLVAVQLKRDSNIWIAPRLEFTQARQFTFSSINGNYGFNGLAWTPDGGLVFTANVDRSVALYSVDANGGNIKQITSAGFFDQRPKVTPDGRFIVFQSNRSQRSEIWRVGTDGTDLRQLTKSGGNSSPTITPDSLWVVYTAVIDGKSLISRVSIEGGEPVNVTRNVSSEPSVSPDGKYIACLYKVDDNTPMKLAIISFTDGLPLNYYDVPSSARFDAGLNWSEDGRALDYRDYDKGVWRQEIGGGPPNRIKGIPEEEVFQFSWSRDGRLLAFARAHTISDVVLLRDRK